MVAGLQHTRAQYVYGTTGLLHAPSADMQRDKTFLCGFSYLQVAATPKHWNYDTWNYYINITLFPWLEVGYTCTLHKIGLPQYGYSYKFRNQDRQFSARLRVWKEGWWKEWTPQIVVGANDPSTNDVLGDQWNPPEFHSVYRRYAPQSPDHHQPYHGRRKGAF